MWDWDCAVCSCVSLESRSQKPFQPRIRARHPPFVGIVKLGCHVRAVEHAFDSSRRYEKTLCDASGCANVVVLGAEQLGELSDNGERVYNLTQTLAHGHCDNQVPTAHRWPTAPVQRAS